MIHQDVPDLPLAYVPRFFTYHGRYNGFTTDGDGKFNDVTFGLSRVWLGK